MYDDAAFLTPSCVEDLESPSGGVFCARFEHFENERLDGLICTTCLACLNDLRYFNEITESAGCSSWNLYFCWNEGEGNHREAAPGADGLNSLDDHGTRLLEA